MTALATAASFPVAAQAPQEPAYQGKIGRTLAESKEWWPAPVQAPKNAPNIVWILLDDVGFGAASAFGGGIDTPVLEALADQGLRYTNFHTTAICAPTRAALLTGRDLGIGPRLRLFRTRSCPPAFRVGTAVCHRRTGRSPKSCATTATTLLLSASTA
ncbi:sulfatase-like hydrolase/transferase [Novosphingobium colocasiae]